MNWLVLIVPSGIRMQMRLGYDLDKDQVDYNSLMHRVAIQYYFETGNKPIIQGQMTREFRNHFNERGTEFAKERSIDPTSQRIYNLIKGTENESLEVIVEVDGVDDYDDFHQHFGGGIEGAIDVLSTTPISLVRSPYKDMVKKAKEDYRYRRLSDQGKEELLNRVKDEAKMQDAKLILHWIDKLEANKRPRSKEPKDFFDGLK